MEIIKPTPKNPPRPALLSSDEGSFAYTSAAYRWPVIITKIIDDVYKTRHLLPILKNENDNNHSKRMEIEEKNREGKEIMDSIAGLKYQMQRGKKLIPIEDDGESDIDNWNYVFHKYFERENWYSAAWLFTECYLYRRIRSIFAKTKHWHDYDPFFRQKSESFKASINSVIEISKRIDQLIITATTATMATSTSTLLDQQRIIFHELVLISLWGNATDLSLLPNLNHEDIKKLQNTGDKLLKESEKNILANDLDKVWNVISKYRKTRIDFILDNAGFELFGDLILADWLIQTEYASEIHFHVKSIPWFVSDTTIFDFNWLLKTLNDISDNNSDNINDNNSDKNIKNIKNIKIDNISDANSIKKLINRWQIYIKKNQWIIETHHFWTSPYSYWHMSEQAPDLYLNLSKSSLIIYKGDLNYRKLVYDCKWSITNTSFKEAIGPLASEKDSSPPLLALRTCKAEVLVGIDESRIPSFDDEKDWMYSGKYAVIQFHHHH
ncbi:hypothetical protein Glove_26g297 [Diversispora epigaea]|uniref:Sugar phosphate phosphatase n=1 Tax=Diversispora epigaea TaxID=1348612 RepID=A0A397JT33_9GLOM|nr:hypothetical protein Glove_26g297 [Diversispora epigaea]